MIFGGRKPWKIVSKFRTHIIFCNSLDDLVAKRIQYCLLLFTGAPPPPKT